MEENEMKFKLPDENEYAAIQEVKPVEASSRNKKTAILLAFFLGSLGVHSFYLGFTKKGVAQLLCSLIGISFVWALIDFFRLLFQPEQYDADGNLLT